MSLPDPPIDIAPPKKEIVLLRGEDPLDESLEMNAAASRDAARQAVPFTWKGKQLAPFTPSREAAFHQHRAGINAPSFSDAISDSSSFAADAARMLWYLSHEPADWLNFLGAQPRGEVVDGEWQPRSAHAALEARIQKWMDETWTGTKEERVEAYTLCIEIMTRSTSTRPKHQDPGDPDESGNGHGLP